MEGSSAENQEQAAKRPGRRRVSRAVKWVLPVVAGTFVVLQLLPLGESHTNPRQHAELPWDSPRTRELVVGACYDCHSNRTDWPWYSYIAPASWLVTHDVHRGREALNFSLWPNLGEEGEAEVEDDLFEVVLEKEMPPRSYGLLHSDARLSESERQELVQGLRRTLGVARLPEKGEQEEGEEGEDE